MTTNNNGLFDESKKTSETIIPLHGSVVCDSCNDDYTNSPVEGGIIFSSYGYCPGCTPRMMREITKYNEKEYIEATCPEGTSFADFIREYRSHLAQGDNIIIKGYGK